MTSAFNQDYFSKLFSFNTNEKEKKIWRYMDFAKFMSLIETEELYFCRGDKFEDKLEGSYSKLTIENIDRLISMTLQLSGMNILQDEVRNLVSLINQINRFSVFVSCWHMEQHESYAMWDLYTKNKEGIAIQSTIKRVEESFYDQASNITAGKVSYINFETDELKGLPIEVKDLLSAKDFSISITPINAFLHKRISFSHEKEMRFVVDKSCEVKLPLPQEQKIQVPSQTNDHYLRVALDKGNHILTEKLKELKNTSSGLKVKIKPNYMDTLIEKIYISPNASGVFSENLLRGILAKYSLNIPVNKSDLNTNPLF